MCCVQGFGEPRLLSPPPIPTPIPELQEGFQTSPTDPPTGVDDPNYENITVTLRKQDNPKGSHAPSKSEGKWPCQPTSLSFGRGLWEGIAVTVGSSGGQDQWCRVWWLCGW